ncbi:MAG: hypothetical protein K8I27_04520 [Planctomycetes bacterium]|nr:hypothetical protein [Planctomycetota bacterium]
METLRLLALCGLVLHFLAELLPEILVLRGLRTLVAACAVAGFLTGLVALPVLLVGAPGVLTGDVVFRVLPRAGLVAFLGALGRLRSFLLFTLAARIVRFRLTSRAYAATLSAGS